MKKLTALLSWIDRNILHILVIGFIYLIPLYPKLPLRMINYTFVAIRVEDIYMAIVAIVFLILLFRRRVTIPIKLGLFFVVFWVINFVSYLWGYHVQETVIINHLGFLHSLRRVEYMMIFFIVLASVRKKSDFFLYLHHVWIVLSIVVMYGFGQKLFGWPAVQTMNPEYAKGYFLVLESWARISSTFAGHYDLSAYLILLMPILIGYYLYSKRISYLMLFFMALASMVLAASRASYIAYLMSIILFLVYIRKFKLLVIILIATAIMTPLSDNLASRFSRTFQQTKVFVDSETGDAFVSRKIRPDDLPPGDYGAVTGFSIGGQRAVLNPQDEIDAKKQIRDSLIKEAQDQGKVYNLDEINASVEKIFARQIPITKYLPDISLSTRFQVSWPRAFGAFLNNIWIGNGPSSLGEATDGDYFRWLGEVGLLGTGVFLTIFGVISGRIFYHARKMSKSNSYLFHGFVFGFIGLFINASYIDIFEASKLAYMFWFLAGLYYVSYPLFLGRKLSVKKLKV